MRFVRWIAVLVMAGLVVGPASVAPAFAAIAEGNEAKTTTFVAAVPGTDAYVGIVVGKWSAVAYLCDGVELDEWLSGAASGGILALESTTGATLVARQAGTGLRGTIVLPDDRVLTFNAVRARGEAGVFRRGDIVDGNTLAQTWVRLADGTTRGAEGIVDEQAFVDGVTVQGVDGEPPTAAAVEEALDEQFAEFNDGEGSGGSGTGGGATGGNTPDQAPCCFQVVPFEPTDPELDPPVEPSPDNGTPPADTGCEPGLVRVGEFCLEPPPEDVTPPGDTGCDPGLIRLGEFCVKPPLLPVDEDPPKDAVTPDPDELADTVAGETGNGGNADDENKDDPGANNGNNGGNNGGNGDDENKDDPGGNNGNGNNGNGNNDDNKGDDNKGDDNGNGNDGGNGNANNGGDDNAADTAGADALEVALPDAGAYDNDACARIYRAIALLADELEIIDDTYKTRYVFESVWYHLYYRGTLGGCTNLPAPH